MMDDIWKSFGGCSCLKTVLTKSGYDSLYSLETINANSLAELEDYINRARPSFWEASSPISTSCIHIDLYKKQKKFSFLPGHTKFILSWC